MKILNGQNCAKPDSFRSWARHTQSLLAVVGLMLPFSPAVGADAAAKPSEKSKPNIVVIVTDDWSYMHYGFMGHQQIETPTLDKLAAGGLVFTRGYVTTAFCAPSQSSIMSGIYPHQHGIFGNFSMHEGKPEPRYRYLSKACIDRYLALPLMPRLLKNAGYLTMHAGKFWPLDPEPAGFTDSAGSNLIPGSKESNRIGRETMQPVHDFVDKAVTENKAFFLWFSPFMPHGPYTPPKELLDKYIAKGFSGKTAAYYGMCEWTDRVIGEMLAHMEQKGVAENTLFIYISDNGLQEGECPKVRGAKWSPYELGVKQPILLHWRNVIKPGRDEQHAVSAVDILPTVLAACGVAAPSGLTGINLLDPTAVAKPRGIFIEHYYWQMLDPAAPQKTLQTLGVISGDWKLLVTHRLRRDVHGNFFSDDWGSQRGKTVPESVELFNLHDDPWEKDNLAAQQPDKVAELRKLLDAHWQP